MDKNNLIVTIAELYKKGGNIIQYLRDAEGRDHNTTEDILISYDFQAGSYIRYANDNMEYVTAYTKAVAEIIKSLIPGGSVLEAGVGEATTLGNVAFHLTAAFDFGGFDISWSRISCGKQYLKQLNIKSLLVTGDLFQMPFADSSVDLVYTSHSIEPNGGREEEALRELFRVASRYVVLLEPGYEFASDDGKKRMKKNGYVTNLPGTINSLGYDLVEHRKFEHTSNPLNPTAVYIIKKHGPSANSSKLALACPITKGELIEKDDHFYSPKGLISYPKVSGIPCLLPHNAILTTKMLS
jgi:SAM-dependent methyltransferase